MKVITTDEIDNVSGGALPVMGAVWVFYTLAGPAFALGVAGGIGGKLDK